MVNFKANFINTASIVKYGINDKPNESKASFVELNPLDENDYIALNKVNKEWDNRSTYANDITSRFNRAYIAGDDSPKEKFYALTLQKDHFESLRDYDVLGLALVDEYTKSTYYLDYLQVAPEYKHTVLESHIKHIGTAILTSLKRLVPIKNILLDAVNSEIEFYKRNGFKIESRGRAETVMRWVGKNSEKIKPHC